jgi:hypothetical protein
VKLELPRNIRFDKVSRPGTLKVGYLQPHTSPRDEAAVLADPLDLWGIAWILGNDAPERIIDVRPPRGLSLARRRSLVLRLALLQECVAGFEFLLDGTTDYLRETTEIRGDIRSGLLFTYDRSNVHRGDSSAKPTTESKFASWIVEHGRKFLLAAFPHRLVKQFPANVFKTSLAERNRATSKLFIDLLGADKEGRLSVVRLNPAGPLTMNSFALGLDCAVFCREFRTHLRRNWFPEATSERIALYLISDGFNQGLVPPDGEWLNVLAATVGASEWLDVIGVHIDSASYPHSLAERIVFPVAAPAVVLPASVPPAAVPPAAAQ